MKRSALKWFIGYLMTGALLFAREPLPYKREEAGITENLYNKRQLTDFEFEKKREDFYITGIGGPFYSPDFGPGGAVILAMFSNGKRSDPLFRYRPYSHRYLIGAFVSAGGFQEYAAGYDAPYLANSLFRLRAKVTYSRNSAENYFGRGESTLGPLRLPGGQTFARFSDYSDEARKVGAAGETYARYFQYTLERAEWIINLERDAFGGLIRYQGGLQIGRAWVKDYSGLPVIAQNGGQETEATQATTKLREDFNGGKISGFGGGWDNAVNLGVALDFRDYEANPRNGGFIDLTANIVSRKFGSDFDYQRLNFSPRLYYFPFPKIIDAVIATRFLYSANFGDVPFFTMNRILTSDKQIKGLGGLNTIRGFRQDRFVGRVSSVYTLEMRYTFMKTKIWNQDLQFMLVPFFDIGSVFDSIQNTRFEGWRSAYGSGFRIAWNQATIILMDFGLSAEGSSFFFNVDHTF